MFLRFGYNPLRGALAALAGAALLLTGAFGGAALAQVQAEVPARYSRDEVFACMLYIEVWRKTLPEDKQGFPIKASNWWNSAYEARGGPSYRLYEEDVRERITDNAIRSGFQTCMRIYQGDQTASLAGPMDVIRRAVAMGPPLVDQRAAAKRQQEEQAAAERSQAELEERCDQAVANGLRPAMDDLSEADRMMASWNATGRYGTNYAWEPFRRGCRRIASTWQTLQNMNCPSHFYGTVQQVMNKYVLYFDSGAEYCKP